MIGTAEHGHIDMLIFLEAGALAVGECEDDYYEAAELAEGAKAIMPRLDS